jgi:hypothetical protein
MANTTILKKTSTLGLIITNQTCCHIIGPPITKQKPPLKVAAPKKPFTHHSYLPPIRRLFGSK